MKRLFEILVFMLVTTFVYSAEPIVELEPFPTLEQFQTYEDSEVWFYNKVLEYYKISIIYETQIKALGDMPAAIPQIPSLDDLESVEFKILRKYYNTADKLKNQVINMGSGAETKKIIELQQKIKQLEKDIFTIKDQNFQYSLDIDKSNFYKERYEESIKQINEIKYTLDSTFTQYHKNTLEIYSLMNHLNDNLYTVIGLGISANQLYYQKDNADAVIAPALSINFNPGKIFGFGRLLDFWAEYRYIKSEVKSYSNNINNSTDMYSLGLALNIPLDEVFKIKDFNSTFKFGYGYFHSNTYISSSDINSISSNGNIIKLELNFSNFSKFFPFTIFTNLDFCKYNKNLILFGDDDINLGKPWVTNFAVGFRFPLWQSLKDLPQ